MEEVLKIKKLYDSAKIPTKGTTEAAGYDLYSASTYDIEIPREQTVKIGTGIAVEIPKGCFGAIFARSGLATKKGLRLANSVGVIDSDYRGELVVALHNDSNIAQYVGVQERIAQLVIIPYKEVEFEEVNELEDTERGEGGFGSTGVK